MTVAERSQQLSDLVEVCDSPAEASASFGETVGIRRRRISEADAPDSVERIASQCSRLPAASTARAS